MARLTSIPATTSPNIHTHAHTQQYENFKRLFSARFLHPHGSASATEGKPVRRTTTRSRAGAGKAGSGAGLGHRSFLNAERLREQAADVLITIRQSLPHMAAGALAGSCAAAISNPLDIVKTRMQTQQGKPASLAFFTGLREVVRQEGLRRSLFRGLAPKIASTAPLGMISSVMYEGILFLSRKKQGEGQQQQHKK